jgi:hypothetical protein
MKSKFRAAHADLIRDLEQAEELLEGCNEQGAILALDLVQDAIAKAGDLSSVVEQFGARKAEFARIRAALAAIKKEVAVL